MVKRHKERRRQKKAAAGGFIDIDAYINGPVRTTEDSKTTLAPSEDKNDNGKRPQNGQLAPAESPADKNGKSDNDKSDNGKSDKVTRRKSTKSSASKSDRDVTGDPAFFAARRTLPIWESRSSIRQALSEGEGDVLILAGKTGSGKSTQVPQYLFDEPWCKGLVAVTQPRRMAATTLAYRVARETGTPLTGNAAGKGGQPQQGRVGYSVRFDYRMPKGTRIKFLTEGMLLQEMLQDASLSAYSCIVVDEVHERSVDVDLLLGFLKQILEQQQTKPRRGGPLKVVVMSATADIDSIRQFFSERADINTTAATATATATAADRIRVLQIPGRQHPVKIIHTSQPVPNILDAMLETVFKLHVQKPLPGDILVFLVGQEDILASKRLIEEKAATLASNIPHIEVCPLFGQLSIEAQYKAFQPASRSFTRKVVLATNIAETSVTVPGVRYVVDGGKAKIKMFHPSLGIEALLVKPIAQSSAIQRTGRAGREGPGECHRLYTETGFKNLKLVDRPEIERIDILGAVLAMKARGIENIFTFPLMNAPDGDLLEKALIQLHDLGAIDDAVGITAAGRTMSRLPVPVLYGRVLLEASAQGCLREAIDIIACLTAGDDIFHQLHASAASSEGKDEESVDNEENENAMLAVEERRRELQRREGDLLTYWTTMQRFCAEPRQQRTTWCQERRINLRNMRQAMNIRQQLRGLCAKQGMGRNDDNADADEDEFVPLPPDRADVLLQCFVRGFVRKTAMLAPDGSYVTTYGKHVVAVHPSSVMHGRTKPPAIMYQENVYTQRNYARKVSAIQTSWIIKTLESLPKLS